MVASEQWPVVSLKIALSLAGPERDFAFKIPKVPAGAGIHRGDQHELGGKSHPPRRSRNGDLPVFDWLAHHFEGRSFKLRQFIEKEDAVVRKTDFARIWKCAAAEQTNVADGMMRRAKRPLGNEGAVAAE